MKHIFNIIIMVLVFYIISNIHINPEPNYIHPKLLKYYNNFIKECDSLDINIYNIKRLDSITFKTLNNSTLGLHTGSDIYIANKLLPDKNTNIEVVIYHEFGHALDLQHEPKNKALIMSDSIFITEEANKYRKPVIHLLKQIYFHKLKQISQ